MKKDMITKKDFIYWILFLITSLIFVITWRLSPETEVVQYFSFGGTIVSILLALVALIYSFYQNFTMQSSSDKLNESVNEIELSVSELKDFDSNIKAISNEINIAGKELSSATEVINIKLIGIIEDLQNRIKTIESHHINTSELVKSLLEEQSSDVNHTFKTDVGNIGIEICKRSEQHFRVIRILYQYFQEKRIFSMNQIIDQWNEDDKVNNSERNLAYFGIMLSNLVLFDRLDIVKIHNLSYENMSVTQINDELKLFLKEQE